MPDTKSANTKKKTGTKTGSGSAAANKKKSGGKQTQKKQNAALVKTPGRAETAAATLLMAVAVVLTAACLLFPGVMGAAGRFIRDVLCGLFGYASFFLPLFLAIAAYFMRRDMEQHAVALKTLFGFLCMALIAVLFHCGHVTAPEFETESMAALIAAWYKQGTAGFGGGVIGGAFAWLFHFIGIAGTLIVVIPAILLLFIFFIGMTPHSLIITIQYYHFKRAERREAIREAAAPEREARQAELDRRAAELEEMRRVQAERQRIERDRRAVEAEVRRGTRRSGRIDSNIYTDSAAENLPPDPVETVDYFSDDGAQKEKEQKSGRKNPHEVRTGAPVPGEVFDRGEMNSDGMQTVSSPAGTAAAEPAKPDETAYALAEQDERQAARQGMQTQDTASLTAAKQEKEPQTVSTGELDLNEIFSSPKDEDLLRRYGPSAGFDRKNEEAQSAEMELNVTRTTPDGCETPGDDDVPLADAPMSTAREEDADAAASSGNGDPQDGTEKETDVPWFTDAPAAQGEKEPAKDTADLPKIALDDDAAALLQSLNAFYGSGSAEALPDDRPKTETLPAEKPAEQTGKPTANLEPEKPQYVYPPVTLLKKDTSQVSEDLTEELEENGEKLEGILRSFNVKTKVVNISRGPTVTRYELQPEAGTRVRSVTNLVDDIALGMAASGVRIEAPIPGKNAVGIEVPNRTVSTVYIRDLIECDAFTMSKSRLTTCLGMDVAGTPVYLDVAKMPHLLICGATGMGKSVCINSLIVSMLYKATPDEVKLILIDPKKVELNIYSGIPHLLVPVVSDPKKAAGALHWAVTEMERRFELIEDVGVRDLKGYNEITKNDPDREHLSQIVIIIDELADLMMTAPDDVEDNICRIAQKARAAGMHLIIGTQRPSVDVITGLIKANIPSRIAFRVSSQMDSRVVLDTIGAEKLIGRGDMLYAPVGAAKPLRVQGSFVSEDEIDQITTFLKKTAGHAEYASDVIETIEREAAMCGQKKGMKDADGAEGEDDEAPDDPMLRQAVELAVESGKISTSLIQRRLSLGYGRAAKLIDRMEMLGYVSAPEGQKPRQVLITKEEFMEMVLNKEGF